MSARSSRRRAGQERQEGQGREKAQRPEHRGAGERSLTDTLGLAVEINHRGRGGSVKIKYKTLDQLDEVARRLEGRKR